MSNFYVSHSKDAASKNIHATQWQLTEVEIIIEELGKVLAAVPHLFDGEKMARELEVLQRWRNHYRSDLVTAEAFGETSLLVVTNLYDHLKLALEEIQRTEMQGGSELAHKKDMLIHISHRIERIMSSGTSH